MYSELHKNDPVPPSNSVNLALRATQLDAPTTVDRDDYSWAPPAAAFKANLRQLIDWPVDSAGVIQPVTTNTPLVEATFMEGKNGWVIPLANYTGTPLKKVAVVIRNDGRPFGPVRSSRQGEVQVESAGQGAIRILLPLESTDMIYAPWRDNRE